ncbi:hypothetical protein P879_01843 [Paragonimus westermani]|uniref:Calcium uniporter protein n=1 Tax=Paragonimus westermani TaxID=34504 RepID=A0A8T0DYP0_9TREM|nr:hypothetical protein P879_01843 [Paragonimus westermani]
MTLRGIIYRLSLSRSFKPIRLKQGGHNYSTTAVVSTEPVRVVLENGLPQFYIPLPSRREICLFTVKPLQHTVGDLASFIMAEDHGVDHVAFINKNGNRIAKSNSVADLLGSDFQIVINEDRFNVDSSAIVSRFDSSGSEQLADIRMLITRLATTINADEFQLKQQRELERRIEDVCSHLQSLEEKKSQLSLDAARRTRTLTWLGLGAMGLQFGLLARLTWWEYSWDIMEPKKSQLSLDAARRTRTLTWLGLGAMGLQFGLLARLTWWEYSWDIMEPVTYFVGYGTSMALYAYYVVTRQSYEFPQVFNREYLKRFYKVADKTEFDVNRYNDLREQLAQLKSELCRLRDPLLCNLPLQQTGYLIPEKAEEAIARGPGVQSNGLNFTSKR